MIERMQCKNSKDTEIKPMTEWDHRFIHVRKCNSRINEYVLPYRIFCSSEMLTIWPSFLKRIKVSQLRVVSYLYTFQFQDKVCFQYIHKFTELDLSVTKSWSYGSHTKYR